MEMRRVGTRLLACIGLHAVLCLPASALDEGFWIVAGSFRNPDYANFQTEAVARAHAAFLAWRETWPGSVIGTRLDGSTGYRETAVQKPALILMGNEQAGLTDELAAACDVNVKIPMRGRADSLNLAIATGIMVYAVTD